MTGQTQEERSSAAGKGLRTATLALHGVKWGGLAVAVQKTFQLASIAVLARLLTPEDFGVVTIATLTLGAVSRIKQLGLYSALMQRKGDIRAAANVSFYISVALAVLAYAGLWLAAPYVAAFFKRASAERVVTVMSLRVFMDVAAGIQSTLAVRDLKFRKQAVIAMIETVVTTGSSVVFACMGWGVWALVYGSLAGPVTSSIVWWAGSTWRPGLVVDMKAAREVMGFGAVLSLATTVDSLLDTVSRALVGRFLGIVPLGFFDFTNRINQLPFRNVMEIGHRVAIPAFCREQENTERLRAWYLQMTGLAALLMAPVCTTLLLAPDVVVPLVFGPQWLPTLPWVRALAGTTLLMPFLYGWPVYIARARLGLVAWMMTARLLLGSALVFLAARVSLMAVCLALLALTALFAVVNVRLVSRLLGLRLSAVARTLRTPLLGTLVLACAFVVSRFAAGRMGLLQSPGVATFGVVLGPPLALYGLIVHLLEPRISRRLRETIWQTPAGVADAAGESGG